MTIELKACPFCQGQAQVIEAHDDDGRFAAVVCVACGAGSRQHYFLGDDAREYAAAAWNKRPRAAAERAEWGSATTVGQLIGQLLTLNSTDAIHGAYFVEIDGKKVAKVRGVTLSREHVDGNTIRGGDKSIPLRHVIWTQPDEREGGGSGSMATNDRYTG